jgi:hypothetical protein
MLLPCALTPLPLYHWQVSMTTPAASGAAAIIARQAQLTQVQQQLAQLLSKVQADTQH